MLSDLRLDFTKNYKITFLETEKTDQNFFVYCPQSRGVGGNWEGSGNADTDIPVRIGLMQSRF